MKKRWIFALALGAVAVTAVALTRKNGNGNGKNTMPEFGGFCNDSDLLKEELDDYVDTTPSILRDRTRV